LFLKLISFVVVGTTSLRILHDNLFTLLSCLAGESVTDRTNSTPTGLKNFALEFEYWMNNVEKKPHIYEELLCHFPDKCWPPAFIAYVEGIRSSDPHLTFVKTRKIEEYSLEDRKLFFFGEKVKTEYNSTRREINHYFNPYWIDPAHLPQGASRTGLLLAIRKKYWPVRAWELAKNAIQQKYKRTNPGLKFSMAEHENTIHIKSSDYPFNPQYYPPIWLSFVYAGLPSGAHCLNSLQPPNMLGGNPQNVSAQKHMSVLSLPVVAAPRKKRSLDVDKKHKFFQYPPKSPPHLMHGVSDLDMVGDMQHHMSGHPSVGAEYGHSSHMPSTFPYTATQEQSHQPHHDIPYDAPGDPPLNQVILLSHVRRQAIDSMNRAINTMVQIGQDPAQLRERLFTLQLEEVDEAENILKRLKESCELPYIEEEQEEGAV
jgi:hypothetical protein